MNWQNSVNLANEVWKEVKHYSIVPSPNHLKSVVKNTGEQYKVPQFTIDNAYNRVQSRLDNIKKAFEQYNKDKTQESLEKLHVLLRTPIKDGQH